MHTSMQASRLTITFFLIILAGTLLISCKPANTGEATKASPQASSPQQETPASSSKEIIVQSPAGTPAVDVPGVVPIKEPIKTEVKTEGVPGGVKLIPTGEFTDDDLIVSMTILKFELGVRPELKMTDISRLGEGKDATILVETSLSSTKPLVAVINALMNRERFEGKLGEKVLFNNNDLRFVCKIPACAGVEDMGVCPQTPKGYECTWAFGLVLYEPAAKRISEATKGMPTKTEGNDTLISEPINLYLNGQLLDYVYIPADTAGTPITDMTISGNATGATPKEAQQKAVSEMDRIRNKMGLKVMPVELKVAG